MIFQRGFCFHLHCWSPANLQTIRPISVHSMRKITGQKEVPEFQQSIYCKEIPSPTCYKSLYVVCEGRML